MHIQDDDTNLEEIVNKVNKTVILFYVWAMKVKEQIFISLMINFCHFPIGKV